MSVTKEMEQYVQMAVGLEAVLHATRDSIYHEILLSKKQDLENIKSQMQFCTKKDKNTFLKIKKSIEKTIDKYNSHQKKNKRSKDITRLFAQANEESDNESLDKFKDKSQDLYAEFAELLHEMYSLDYIPNAHASILIEHPDGDCDYKGKKFFIMIKK